MHATFYLEIEYVMTEIGICNKQVTTNNTCNITISHNEGTES